LISIGMPESKLHLPTFLNRHFYDIFTPPLTAGYWCSPQARG
jgi:hypothetical protein